MEKKAPSLALDAVDSLPKRWGGGVEGEFENWRTPERKPAKLFFEIGRRLDSVSGAKVHWRTCGVIGCFPLACLLIDWQGLAVLLCVYIKVPPRLVLLRYYRGACCFTVLYSAVYSKLKV